MTDPETFTEAELVEAAQGDRTDAKWASLDGLSKIALISSARARLEKTGRRLVLDRVRAPRAEEEVSEVAEYIEDARDALIAGDRVPHPYFYDRSAPAPAFRDRFGNLITVGDWVVIGTRDGNVGCVLLSRVEKIEPVTALSWSRTGEEERVVLAAVTVKSLRQRVEHYSGQRVETWHWKKASRPNVANMVSYNGKVPDVHE